jgi:cytochrome b
VNASSVSRAERRILVWDAPVRVFHWLMVASFVVAFATHEGERWRLLHVTAGYTMAGLVAFRLLWGLVGTRHARFADFVRGPVAVAAYLKSLLQRRPEHHVGHNPAGALAVLGLLTLTVVSVASGWTIYNDLGGEWLEEMHELAGNLMLLLVLLHVLGVVISSRLHHENLVGAMVTGRKTGDSSAGIAHAWRGLAALMLVAAMGFWAWQWQTAPTAGTGPAVAQAPDHDDD